MMIRRSILFACVSIFLLGFGCSDDPGGGGGADAIFIGGEDGATGGEDASSSDGETMDEDSESVDADEDDADQQDTSQGGADTEQMEDGGGSDGGADAGKCSKDNDSDGLNNCEEERLCTDPNNGDTDGDKLSDLEELQNQTDPCKKDTDGDGATDKEEIDFGLDPNRTSTYNDMTPDGQRWILSACKNPSAEPVNFYKSATGNWTTALPPAFNNYTELKLSNSMDPETAAVYDDTANEVAGYLLSKNAKTGQNGPTDALRNDIRTGIASVGSVIQDQTGGEFDTHDKKKAAIGRYLIQLGNKKSVRKVRDELLFGLAPFSKSDAKGLPNSSGAQYSKFRVFISVIFRENKNGTDQSLISVSVAPGKKYDNIDKVKFRMDDLTNTTNISEQVDSHLVKCATFQPGKGTPKAEFYWVLDQSGSMNDDNTKVANFANQFEKEVRNTSLDYRLGVTNTDKRNNGKLRVPPAWHTNGSTFKSEVQGAVISCSRGGNWHCSGGAEHGIEAAKQGITYMTGQSAQQPTPAERIRSNAQVITIFMSDEEANTFQRSGKSVQPYIQFFKGRTIAFAIVGDGQGCGQNGKAYKDVALGTGGKFASLCAKDLKQTIRDIIFAATGLASNYVLPQTPISSSLRVFLNGTWVPRSRDDGFEYFAENNSIAFFGSFRPSPKQGNNQPGDYIAVSYETFKDRCKQNNAGSANCSPSGP